MQRGISRVFGLLAAVACVLAMASPAGAVTLTFEGLSNLQEVGTFYDSPEFGNVTFAPGTFAYKRSEQAPQDQFFSGEPSADTVISGAAGTVDITGLVDAGFTGAFSLWYSSASNASATITLFDIDGISIASLTLPASGDGGSDLLFDNWCEVGGGCSPVDTTVVSSLAVPDGQIAYSFRLFDPSGFGIAFDDITFTPVPEPDTALLLGLGLVSLAAGGRRARAASL